VTIRAITLIAFIIASLPVCFVRPFYGILLWSAMAILNPQWYTWSADAFRWDMSVAIATLAGVFIFARGWAGRLAATEVLMSIILWIWFTITSVMSADSTVFMHHAQDTWLRWQFVSKLLLMTLATIAIVNSLARLRMLILVIAGSFGFFVLKALPFMIFTAGRFRVYGPEHSMIADNNDFGLALNMTLPIFFFLAQTESKRWVKWLFGILFIATIPAIFFTYSRGALIGLSVVLVLMFLQSKQRLMLIPVIILGTIIALVVAPESWRDRMDPTRPGAMDGSARSRLNAWTFSWRLASDYPITGGGFETFTPELFDRYAPDPSDIHGPHSVYFGVLAEHGFVGLFLYLTLVGTFFASAHRIVQRARLHGDIMVINYTNMFRLGMLGFLVSGLFLGRAYFDYFFTFIACIVILKRLSQLEYARVVPADLTTQEEAA
jgi:putative inorganic carbon (HCO3(-)) transporter